MNNRINNVWDDMRIPSEVRDLVRNRETKLARAGAILIRTDIRVAMRLYDNPHPDGSISYRNWGLFVGPVQVMCLETTKVNNEGKPLS